MNESPSRTGTVRNPLAGQRIGSYRVLDLIGSGGMSAVFRAVHVETGHEVALKVLIGSLTRSSTLLQRFLREARSAETLEHTNIATIYDRGVDQGRHYLVLEYVGGGDFHEYVQRNGPLDVPETIAVVRGVASGLRYAAGRGLIHRDIKPSNILRAPNGEPKIIDLGLALQSQYEDERVTREGTTVGTVDYMSPEQARDSRATSIQSDMYSLGCTFYYLLSGVPPYPGGDITDKLTRHARAPVPDIRDLRPEIPGEVSTILLRMMAKEPGKRYADYDRLIEALDAVGRGGADGADDIPLVPIEEEEPPILPEANPPADLDAPRIDEPDVFSLELSDERDPGDRRTSVLKAEIPLPRLGLEPGPAGLDEALEEEDVAEVVVRPASAPFPSWILATVGAGVLAILLVVGLQVMLGGPGSPDTAPIEIPAPEDDEARARTPERTIPPARRDDDRDLAARKPPPTPPPPPSPPPSREEPEDLDPVAGDLAPLPSMIRDARSHLPDWTRPAPAPPEEKSVLVRRLAGQDDGTTEPTLQAALDRYPTDLVEIADVGPFTPDDLHVSGESRWIRARRGYRPILWIQPPRRPPPQDQTAFVMLRGGGSKGKRLVIEGIDIILDANDLPGSQVALFGCAGADLTLRDCTVTVINPRRRPIALVREVPLRSSEAPRRSHIRLERTLLRGRSIGLADLEGGAVDLVVDASAVLVAGPGRPLIRVVEGMGAEPHRIYFSGALVSCSGPLIHRDHPEGVPTRGKPPIVRADGSAFGRVSGEGILSIATSTDANSPPARELGWSGESNLYVGWRGFFARGKNPQITVDDLNEARSTWNAGEQGSQWMILPDWTLTVDPAMLVAGAMAPSLPAGRYALMEGPAEPSLALFAKTFGSFLAPRIPEPATTTVAPNGPGSGAGPRVDHPVVSQTQIPARDATPTDELVMQTSDTRWSGDLGAFLREKIPAGARSARVRVIGSGAHSFTPVRLPDGLALELVVERDSPGAPAPSWSPAPQSRGPALIELRGGALGLRGLHLRHDPASAVGSLIAVEDAHLVMSHCRLDVPTEAGSPAGDLIVFRAANTHPMPRPPGISAFGAPIDRPVCRLIDTVLVADRTALRAELGRGLVALTRCAVASDDTAIGLDPSRVARRSFECDLWLDGCTLAASRSVVGLGGWEGRPSGPWRPWVIHSRGCAFLTLSDPRNRDGVLLRADADAYDGGALYWQSDGDTFDLDRVLASDGPSTSMPSRPDVPIAIQWQLFKAGHRVSRAQPFSPRISAQIRRRLRPGRINADDLLQPGVLPGPAVGPDGGAGGPSAGGPSGGVTPPRAN